MAAIELLVNHNEADPALCQRCQAFDIQTFSRDTSPWRGYRIIDIIESAKLCCPFCSYLVRCLEEAVGYSIHTKNRDKSRGPSSIWDGSPLGSGSGKLHWLHFRVLRAARDPNSPQGLNITCLQVFLQAYLGLYDNSDPLFDFHVVADPADPASATGDVVGRYISRNTRLPELVEAIKSWVQKCRGEHEKCSRTLSGQPIPTQTLLPTRCLRVTKDPTAPREIRIRLVETFSYTGSYTTLSHRWPAPPKELQGATTSANLANRQAGIETLESSLPRHFVDACILTLQLGYEYIWIDAVCIIQGKDDPEAMKDWAYEAAQMASYYQNSKLTIAATHGDDKTGLFGTEALENSRPIIRLPYRARPGSNPPPLPSFFYLVPTNRYLNKEYGDYVVDSDLLTRGWVVQEWVLSRRILCFTPTSVYFQCTEDSPHNEDGRIRSTPKNNEMKKIYRQESYSRGTLDLEPKLLDLSRVNREVIYHKWLSFIEVYSKRQLTRPETDKLMGVVGIAHEFGSALTARSGSNEANQEHLWVGGVWLTDIRRSLLWEQIIDLIPKSATTNSNDVQRIIQVPSWSWASRKASVQWYGALWLNKEEKLSCELQSVRYDSEDGELVQIPGGAQDQHCLVDPTKTFPVLRLRARLATILVREAFVDEEERRIAAEYSNRSPSGREGRWRKVALSSSEKLICGWVSLDREQAQISTDVGHKPGSTSEDHQASGDQIQPDNSEASGAAQSETYEELSTSSPGLDSSGSDNAEGRQKAVKKKNRGREMQALLVSMMHVGDHFYYFLGTISVRQPVYNILCLQDYKDGQTATRNGFERIGVGNMFGKDAQRLFENTEPQDLLLF